MTSYRIVDDSVVFTSTTPAGYTSGSLQQAMDVARSNGKPLFIQGGTYDVGDLSIFTSSGGGLPLRMVASPGSVTLRFTTGSSFLKIDGVSNCVLEGIIFDMNSRPYTGTGSAAAIQVHNASRTHITSCEIKNSLANALVFFNCGVRQTVGLTGVDEIAEVAGDISGCNIHHCDAALFATDNVGLSVLNNNVHNCSNAGLLIWQSQPRLDGSQIKGNLFTNIDAAAGGTGQNGNGVNIYRGKGCVVTGNRMRFCKFTAVRANVASDTIITNNNIYCVGETAIFAEEADNASGENNVGTVVSNNIIDICGSGISVTNFNNGGRLATVTGNIIRNARQSVNPSVSYETGNGIGVEGDCVVTGNIVECALRIGIVLGVNYFCRNLVCSDNIVRRSAIGIALSWIYQAGHTLVTDNMIEMESGVTTENAIATVEYTGGTSVIKDTMSGINKTDYPNITLGLNVAHNNPNPDPKPTSCLATLPSF